MNGLIFDIQRFSVFDGPGIRTNVFFKGCNLRCKWCHNPESQESRPQLMVYQSKCVGCGKCVGICGNTFTESCTACGKCAEACEHGARKITGKEMTSEEVFSLVRRDIEFYRTSGGGVTLSGGEPLLQADFAAEVLRLCKTEGIHTAIETAACVPQSAFEKVLPFLDLVLCDIKCIDEKLHKELTGVSNRQILQNAEWLKTTGKNIIFRMPVIPGLNDGETEKVKEFAGDFPLELMAYHVTGNSKYENLGRDYSLSELPPAPRDFMERLAEKTGAEYHFTGM